MKILITLLFILCLNVTAFGQNQSTAFNDHLASKKAEQEKKQPIFLSVGLLDIHLGMTREEFLKKLPPQYSLTKTGGQGVKESFIVEDGRAKNQGIASVFFNNGYVNYVSKIYLSAKHAEPYQIGDSLSSLIQTITEKEGYTATVEARTQTNESDTVHTIYISFPNKRITISAFDIKGSAKSFQINESIGSLD